MEAKTNYTTVGITVAILFCGLLISAFWLSIGFDKKRYKTYAVYTTEAVSGLTEDAPVKYNGVKVGYVKQIKLNKNDPRQVQVILNIEDITPITISTYAALMSQGITGVSYIGLSADSPNLIPLEKMPGEPYPIIPAKPSLLNQFDKVLRDVSDNVNKVAIQLQRLFDDENENNMRTILINMRSFSDVIAKNGKSIDKSLKSAHQLLNNLNTLTLDLQTSSKKFDQSLLLAKGSFMQVSQQILPSTNNLLEKLNIIAVNLQDLSQSMRQNPSILIRGTIPSQPGPGE